MLKEYSYHYIDTYIKEIAYYLYQGFYINIVGFLQNLKQNFEMNCPEFYSDLNLSMVSNNYDTYVLTFPLSSINALNSPSALHFLQTKITSLAMKYYEKGSSC